MGTATPNTISRTCNIDESFGPPRHRCCRLSAISSHIDSTADCRQLAAHRYDVDGNPPDDLAAGTERRAAVDPARRAQHAYGDFMIEFVVRLDNHPGALAALTDVLGDAGINIEAMSAWGANGNGVVRLITDNETITRHVLAEAGLVNTEHRVLTAHVTDEPGTLARVTRQLGDAGVNIEALYVLRSSSDGIELAIAVNDPDSLPDELPIVGGLDTD